MKKVYLRPGWFVVFGLVLFSLTYGMYTSSELTFWGILVIAGAGLFFIFFFFYTFFPLWEYDENGFEKNIFLTRKRNYAWSDISEIQMPSSDIVWIITKNGIRTNLGKMMVRNYEKILLEVVTYIQKNNPDLKMDSFFKVNFEKINRTAKEKQ